MSKKRILAWLLTVMMIIGLVPANVFADEVQQERTNNTVLKESFGEQGNDGWRYGMCDWDGKNFAELPFDSENNRYYNNGKPELKADFVEPGNGKNAAYQWEAAKDGTIVVKGEYVKFANSEDPGADGTCVRIFLNGEEKKWMGSQTMGNFAEEKSEAFEEEYEVKAGNLLTFAVNPEGNDSYDGGRLTVAISEKQEDPQPGDDEVEPDPNRTNNTVLKDSFGKQGYDGWRYGMCEWDGKNFEKLPFDSENNRYYNNGKPELKADFVEPGNGKNAAYQWEAAKDGTIVVKGEYVKFANSEDPGADGTCVRIFLNGEEKKWMGSQTMGNFAEERSEAFEEEYEVKAGNLLTFAVNPEGNDSYDGGRLTVSISEKQETPEPPALEEGIFTLPELEAGPSAMFNHFVPDSRLLVVEGDKATIKFITDGSTASIQKYSKIALGKSSELVQTNYQADLPEGTVIIEGVPQADDGSGTIKYLFEVTLPKSEVEALLVNEIAEDIYIVVYNKEGSSADKIPGWYKPSNDIYLSLGTLGDPYAEPVEPTEATIFVIAEEKTNKLGYVNKELKVTSEDAKKAGINKAAEYEGKVTAADAMAAMHADLYEDFYEKPADYLVINESSGFITTIFGKKNSEIMYYVNNEMPADEEGTGTAALDTVLEDGDKLHIFPVTMEDMYMTRYLYFENEDITAAAGDEIKLVLTGTYPMMGDAEIDPEGYTVTLYKADDIGGTAVASAQTDEDGAVTFKIEEAGKYAATVTVAPDDEYDFETNAYAAPYAEITVEAKPEKIELTITNNLNMFKFVTAYLEKADDKTNLVAALSGSGYHYLFKGTYEEAAANGDKTENWIAGYQNADGKWEFVIPVEEGETYIPLVAVSDSYYQKYLNGQNPIERAFYPRQITIDQEAKTLVADDYKYSKELAVTNNVKMFKVDKATLDTVGGPNSNGYKSDLVLTMGSDSFDKAFIGTAAEAEAAQTTLDITNRVLTAQVRSIKTVGDPSSVESLIGKRFTMAFHSVSKDAWYERDFTIDEAAATLVIDVTLADYTAVDAALEAVPANLLIYTAESVEALKAAIEAVDRTKTPAEQAEVDAMAAAITAAIEGLVEKPISFTVKVGDTEITDITLSEEKYDASYEDWTTGQKVESLIPLYIVKVPEGTTEAEVTLNNYVESYQTYYYTRTAGEDGYTAYIDYGIGDQVAEYTYIAVPDKAYTAQVKEDQVLRVQSAYDENWVSYNLYAIAFDYEAAQDVPVTGFKLKETSVEVAATKTVALTPEFTPENATNKNITWTSSNEKVATVDENGVVTGKVVGKVTITAVTEDGGKKATCEVRVLFSDVTDKTKAQFDAIYDLVDKGVIAGFKNGEYFAPNDQCTRAQVVLFLWRAAGKPKPKSTKLNFTDAADIQKLAPDYAKAIAWGNEQKIVMGFTSGANKGKFLPNDACTRAQIVLFLYRYKNRPATKTTKLTFTDAAEIQKMAPDYTKAILWANETKVAGGYKVSGGYAFKPNQTCTRGECATFLYRALKLK